MSEDVTVPPSGSEEARQQLRGSSLLLVGRFVALGMGFLVQVLIVRYLSKPDYGAFAYALSVAVLLEGFASLGMRRAVARYVPIYDEQGERDRVLGALVVAVGSTLAVGTCGVLLVVGLRRILLGTVIDDPLAVSLLVILIALAPIQALENLMDNVAVIFTSPLAVFFRKYVLIPGLRLVVVLLLIAEQADVRFLAIGYLAAGLLGVAFFVVLLWRVLSRRGLLAGARLRGLDLPFRELFAFAIPLLTTDVMFTVITTSDAVMLGYFSGTEEVASLRAILPVARLNQFVLAAFGLLFTPVAARLYARRDTAALDHLYWQTAAWVAVLSFPIFAVTFSLAGPVTVLLFGADYADSGVLLAILAVGYYTHAALGYNGMLLNVFKLVAYTVVINVAAAILNIVGNLAFVPRYGALGAAAASAGALIVHNALKQAGLRRGTGVRLFPGRYARVYVLIALAAGALAALEVTVSPPLWAGIAIAAVLSLGLVLAVRSTLDFLGTFPELARFRIIRSLFGSAG